MPLLPDGSGLDPEGVFIDRYRDCADLPT
jgi:hypothetical protein